MSAGTRGNLVAWGGCQLPGASCRQSDKAWPCSAMIRDVELPSHVYDMCSSLAMRMHIYRLAPIT